MKRLIFALILVAGTFAASTSNAQVYIGAKIGFGFPHPRVVYAAPAPYYYGGPVIAPVPYYGYRHYEPYCRERRWRNRRYW